MFINANSSRWEHVVDNESAGAAAKDSAELQKQGVRRREGRVRLMEVRVGAATADGARRQPGLGDRGEVRSLARSLLGVSAARLSAERSRQRAHPEAGPAASRDTQVANERQLHYGHYNPPIECAHVLLFFCRLISD